MKIVVSGASGFLGSWICRVLSPKHEVVAMVRANSDTYRLANIESLTVVIADNDMWNEKAALQGTEVLVLCDWEGVGNSERDSPSQIYNLDRQVSLCGKAIKSGVNTVLGVGSQAELGPVSGPISDRQKDGSTTLYGDAKIATRKALLELCQKNDVKFNWLRIFSTYGPLDSGKWLIPNVIDSMIKKQEINLTKCEQEWNYLHAYDAAMAFKFVIENSKCYGVINVGDVNTIRLKNVVEYIGEKFSSSELLRFGTIEYRDDQVMELNPTCETLTQTGWLPRIDIYEGLNQTITWIKRENEKQLKTKDFEQLYFSLPLRPGN
jgi:nucleoside-diphosphate-sugar epimerase